MDTLSRITDGDLLALMPKLVLTERASSADVIEHLVKIDRRRLYLEQACRSLSCFCIERLGYSEDEAAKRVRVTRLTKKFPHVLTELRNGTVHLTGLSLLASAMTHDNSESLLAQARGKSKREIEELIARLFPKPNVSELVLPIAQQLAAQVLLGAATGGSVAPKTGSGATLAPHSGATGSGATLAPHSGGTGAGNTTPVRPLSASSWSIQFTATREFIEKLERASELSSHALPDGKVVAVLERALDALIEFERKRKLGSGTTRKPRAVKAGSRRVPVDVARLIWERDQDRCTFVDDRGRRCSARRFLTIEHRHPYALGGPPTEENLCLLCAPHNARAARELFGDAYVAACSKRPQREHRSSSGEISSSAQNELAANAEARPSSTEPSANAEAQPLSDEPSANAEARPSSAEPSASANAEARPSSAEPSANAEAQPPSAEPFVGEAQTASEIALVQNRSFAKVRAGLGTLGFRESEVQRALLSLRRKTDLPRAPEALLRAALEVLVPRTTPD